MASKKNITASIPVPTTRTVYDRAPKPKALRTPRSEYAFMRRYSALLSIPGSGSTFGPAGGGVAQ